MYALALARAYLCKNDLHMRFAGRSFSPAFLPANEYFAPFFVQNAQYALLVFGNAQIIDDYEKIFKKCLTSRAYSCIIMPSTKNKGVQAKRKRFQMKKTLSLILAVLMVCSAMFVLASCKKEKKEDNLSAAYDKYIEQYKLKNTDGLPTLTIATSPDFAPMEFTDIAKKGDDKYVGFDIILANYIAKELNMKLVIKPMSFDACQAAVQTGNVDMAISGFSWTADRAENYLISDWYVAGDNETEQIIITTKENEGKLTTKESFAGMKIGAQGGSLQELLVKENFGEENLVLNADLGTLAEMLMTGKIDALAVAAGNGEAIISKNPEKLGKTGFMFEIEEKYKNNVILLNKNDAELLEKVNKVLAKAMSENVYNDWYEACQIYSQVKTADELGYDDNGNKITE